MLTISEQHIIIPRGETDLIGLNVFIDHMRVLFETIVPDLGLEQH